MIIPWRSDAPLYYRPIGTIGVIALNVLVYILMASGTISPIAKHESWVMPFGQFTPIQWFTSAFSHAGFWHLAGNMIFLWTFGLVVEGKLGWKWFLGLYLALCMAIGCSEQLIMLGATKGGSLGASSVITALMSIALIWAPYNRMDCLFWFGIRPLSFEWPIWGVSLLFIVWNFAELWLFSGFRMSTPALHLIGAVAGVPAALLFLNRKWVNCEGWDLITVHRNGGVRKTAMAPAVSNPIVQKEKMEALQERKAEALRLLQTYLDEGDPMSAVRVHRNVEATVGQWKLPSDTVIHLSMLLAAKEQWDEAWKYSEQASGITTTENVLTRAMIALRRQRPAKALEILQTVDTARIDTEQRAHRRYIAEEARKLIAAGVVELMD